MADVADEKCEAASAPALTPTLPPTSAPASAPPSAAPTPFAMLDIGSENTMSSLESINLLPASITSSVSEAKPVSLIPKVRAMSSAWANVIPADARTPEDFKAAIAQLKTLMPGHDDLLKECIACYEGAQAEATEKTFAEATSDAAQRIIDVSEKTSQITTII